MVEKVKPRYIRKGECKRCGWCCKYHNCDDLIFVDGLAICSIQETKPMRCVVFPEAPPILHEGCGYHFLDTYENNRIVKYGSDL